MAISIAVRPRALVYYNDASPASPVYSNWNAGWSPIVYEFALTNQADRDSGLIVNIYEVGTNTLLASNQIRSFRTGNIVYDVAPYLRAYLFSRWSANFTSYDNFKDAGNSISFYITYQQVFNDGSPSLFNSDQSRPIVACCSAMQFGDENNGNMEPYMPFTVDSINVDKLKFLTCFDQPVMWEGYPCNLSFIYNKYLIGIQVYKKESQLNVNKQLLSAADINLDPNQVGFVNYLKVSEPSEVNAKYQKLSLYIGDHIPNYYVDQGYVDDGYTQII